jgi:voltage-gated potassium channel
MPHGHRGPDLRRRVYEILERGDPGDRVSVAVDRLIVTLIVVNLAAIALETMPQFGARYALAFDVIEGVSLVVFTVEYALRLWSAVEHAPLLHLSPATRRWRYALSAPGIVDLLAVLPFWFGYFLPPDLRVVLVLRIVRFLKIARYSTAMRSLLDVLYSERRALFGCLVIMIGATLIAAAVMHLAEGHVQPDKFSTIPDAMWWAFVTLGTIGYGDVVPVTPLGKVVAAFTIFFGLIMIALPVGIIANAFAEEIHRRDFVVTWSMVAKVPLFSGLDAGEIAAIMHLLRAQQAEAGATIVRRGEPGHSMYFIAAGEVEIALPNERTHLGVGHFFGEIAVLQRTRRSATITAVTRTSLLVLDASDLRALMERDPRIAERVHEMARGRLKRELLTPKGDLVTEEIEEEPPQPGR